MTEFYKGLEEDRNQVGAARLYIEERLVIENTAGSLTMMHYRTILGTAAINAIRQIDPVGGVATPSWLNRGKGSACLASLRPRLSRLRP